MNRSGARTVARVSIAMSVRDAAATLPAALASLQLQSMPDWELLVADDGSSDASCRLLQAFAAADPRVRLFAHGRSRGLATRLNELVASASAPLIARMDADDIAYPARLERQVAFMDARPEVDLVGCSLLVFGEGGRAIGRRLAPSDNATIVRRPAGGFPLYHPSWLGRAEWFASHPYDPRARRCEDQDLLFRTHARTRFANLTELLMGYREQRLQLTSLLAGRLHMARRWSRSLWVGGRRIAAAATVVEQMAKGALDTTAVTLSAERVLLRHRARPVPATELAEWQSVWRQVSAAAQRLAASSGPSTTG